MADIGQALISKIIAEDDLVTALNAGIKADWFEDQEHRKVYAWMLEYFSRYSETPTPDALNSQYPNYQLRKRVPEPYEYYLDLFRAQRERAILVDTVIDANAALDDDDTRRAQETFSGGLVRLGREVSSLTDENAIGKMRSRYDRYVESLKVGGELTGIATGFYSLDYKTAGYHPQQFILMGGQPKQGKSFMMMKSAIAAHDAGNKVLFLSFEMSQDEQLMRYDSITCGINSMKLLHGTLSDEDLKKLRYGMRLRKNMQPFIVSADISASTTISGLAAKVEQHQPDIIFVDGVYLMDNEVGADPGSPQAYTSISRGLKRLAQRTNKPLVGSTQALPSKMGKDGAVTMGSLGWTSAWAQDTDLLLGVERLPDAPLIRLRVVSGRNVSPGEIAISCNWEESIFEEWDPDVDDENDDD